VASVEQFTETTNYGYFNLPKLQGFIYRNVLEPTIFSGLKKEIINVINSSNKSTFLTNTTIIYDGDKKVKLGLNHFNNRYQNVIYDLTFHKDYWYQTNTTIYDWALYTITDSVSPYFIKFLHTMLSLEPFNQKQYVPHRLHLNYLPTNEGLGLHLDGTSLFYKKEQTEVNQLSLTFYTENHIEGQGGELYTINGFVFKPQENVAIAMNGNQVLHGVTHNINNKPRYAFTVRWSYIDDLFLPGHPDKHLYNIDFL